MGKHAYVKCFIVLLLFALTVGRAQASVYQLAKTDVIDNFENFTGVNIDGEPTYLKLNGLGSVGYSDFIYDQSNLTLERLNFHKLGSGNVSLNIRELASTALDSFPSSTLLYMTLKDNLTNNDVELTHGNMTRFVYDPQLKRNVLKFYGDNSKSGSLMIPANSIVSDGKITLSVWVKPSVPVANLTNPMYIIDGGTTETPTDFSLEFSEDNKLVLRVGNGRTKNSFYSSGIESFEPNVWHSIIVSYDCNEAVFVIDGYESMIDNSSSGCIVFNESTNFTLGSYYWPGYEFNGSMSDLLITSDALNVNSMMNLYNDMIFTGGGVYADYDHIDDHSCNGNETFCSSYNYFVQQLDFWHSNNYTTVSAEDIYQYTQDNYSMPKRALFLSFDAETYGWYEYIYPLLRARNFTATLYPVSEYVNESWNSNDYMNCTIWTKLVNEGFEVGSHTVTHITYNNSNFTDEVLESKDFWKDCTGRPINTFAYPEGAYNDSIADWCATVFHTCWGVDRGFVHSDSNLGAMPRNNVYDIHFSKFVTLNRGIDEYGVQLDRITRPDVSELISQYNDNPRPIRQIRVSDLNSSFGALVKSVSLLKLNKAMDDKPKISYLTEGTLNVNAAFDSSLDTINLSCSGNVTLSNLNALGQSYRVFRDGEFVEKSSSSDYALSDCSECIIVGACANLTKGLSLNYSQMNPTCFLNGGTGNIELSLSGYGEAYPDNDIKNSSYASLVSLNISDISFSLGPNQKVEVGNFHRYIIVDNQTGTGDTSNTVSSWMDSIVGFFVGIKNILLGFVSFITGRSS